MIIFTISCPHLQTEQWHYHVAKAIKSKEALTCGCGYSGWSTSSPCTFCHEGDGVAHARSQAGQRVCGGRSRQLQFFPSPVGRHKRQPVGGDLGPGSLPDQLQGGFSGVSHFQVSWWIQIYVGGG